ncbi:MAG: hypothetical protein KKA42_12325 [candidate division Zixibacteria bacterium]|nr:hypothetical protein [candidate division Zixibacteria bacterium]
MKKLAAILTLLACVAVASCTSRYRLDFHLVQGEELQKVKIERTQYLPDAMLADPMGRDKVAPGPGNCAILVTGTRGKTYSDNPDMLVAFDTYLRYSVFLQLPSRPEPDTISVINNSFVQLMEHYELSIEDRMYFGRSGTLVVDSIPGKHLFGTLDARYENASGEAVAFVGKFKIRIR